MEYIYISKEGLSKLKIELNNLKYNKRPAVSQKVAAAREHGDLKENAEYHAAREELSLLETKIHFLQDRIARARIIKEDEIQTDNVTIFTTVHIEDLQSNKNFMYHLVSEEEADFKQNKISVSSPVGKGLLGKKVGEIAEINAPAGVLRYKILSIKPNET